MNKFNSLTKGCAVIVVILAIAFLFYNTAHRSGNYYSNDVECINARYNNANSEYFSVKDVIFRFESYKQEFIMYISPDGTFWTGHLHKKQIGDNKYYQFAEMTTMFPNVHSQELRKDGAFQYKCVKDKSDIEKYDFNGNIPECFELNYTINDNNESCFIFISNT